MEALVEDVPWNEDKDESASIFEDRRFTTSVTGLRVVIRLLLVATAITVFTALQFSVSCFHAIYSSEDDPSFESRRPLSCTWSPEREGHINCREALRALVCPRKDPNKLPRLLSFGDSTMHGLSHFGHLDDHLRIHAKLELLKTRQFSCEERIGISRCNLNVPFGLDTRKDGVWFPPTDGLEGPTAVGLEQHYCSDCRGCGTRLLHCVPYRVDDARAAVAKLNPDKQLSLIYGGNIGIEFARDVELQSDLFPTTQENVAYFLQQEFNNPDHLAIWEKPTCLVNTGHHDVTISGLTQEQYIENVRWYLELLAEQCQHIVWLSTTAPDTDDRPQKRNQTKAWGHAVRNMMGTHVVLREKALYLDVFEASTTYEHSDNSTLLMFWRKRECTICSLFVPSF